MLSLFEKRGEKFQNSDFQSLFSMSKMSESFKFLWGFFLVLSIKNGPVKCAKVCGKSVVIFRVNWEYMFVPKNVFF